jgi:hypothetical protein
MTDLMANILRSNLSSATKQNYESRKRTLERTFNKPMEEILRAPVRYGRRIQEIWGEPKTQIGYIAFILSLFKHNAKLRKKKSTEERWRNIMIPLQEEIEDKRKTNEPTERQQKGYVPFEEIALKRSEYPKGSEERLLLAMYSLRPPARADYNALRIYDTEPEELEDPNYIVLDYPPRLVLHEYKTAKRYGRYEEVLPPELVEEICESIIEQPRDYLFGKRSGNTYTRYVNRMLSRMFGKPLTIGLIRHAAVNSIDMNTATTKEKERLAKRMMHNTKQQEEYRLLFPQEKTSSP